MLRRTQRGQETESCRSASYADYIVDLWVDGGCRVPSPLAPQLTGAVAADVGRDLPRPERCCERIHHGSVLLITENLEDFDVEGTSLANPCAP